MSVSSATASRPYPSSVTGLCRCVVVSVLLLFCLCCMYAAVGPVVLFFSDLAMSERFIHESNIKLRRLVAHNP